MNQEQALKAVAFLSFEEIFVKVEYLFRWSDVEVSHVVSKAPFMMRMSKDLLQIRSDFLIYEVGLEPAYIFHWPAMLCYK